MPFDVQLIQDTGIPGVQIANAVEGDNQTDILVTAAQNVNGIQLWSASISSYVNGGTQVDDQIKDGSGQVYMSLENGPSGAVGITQELHGMVVPAGRQLQLTTGASGATHKTACTVIYSLL